MTDEHRPGSKRRAIAWLVIIGAVLVLAVVSAVTSSPRACASCHAMKPYADSLASSKHAKVACYSCHLDNGLWDFPAFKAGEFGHMYPLYYADKVSGPGIQISRQACLRCHADILTKVVFADGKRIRHSTCAPASVPCQSCHTQAIHGSATRWKGLPVMEDCVVCHVKQKGPTACDSCHAGQRQSARLSIGPWQVTHGPTWRTTHGLGNLTYCVTCHPAGYCVQCHGLSLPHPSDFGTTHGSAAVRPGSTCVKCHEQKLFCDACHGLPMPHPTGFKAQHPTVAATMSDPRCIKCHVQSDCEACHVKHVHPATTKGTLGDAARKAGAVK